MSWRAKIFKRAVLRTMSDNVNKRVAISSALRRQISSIQSHKTSQLGAPLISSKQADTNVAKFSPVGNMEWDVVYWADGSRFSTNGYVDASLVATWQEELRFQGTDYSFSASGVQQPLLETNGINGQPVILADGSNDIMESSVYEVENPFTLPKTIVMIGRVVSGSNGTMYDGLNESAALFWTGGQWAIDSGTTLMGGAVDTDAHLFVHTIDENAAILEVDNDVIIAGDAGATQPTGHTLFAFEDGSGRGNVEMAFFAVHSDPKSDPNWAFFVDWARKTYGLDL